MNPLEGVRLRLLDGGRCIRQRLFSDGEVPDGVIHLHAGLSVLRGSGRFFATEPQVNTIAGGRKFSIGFLLCKDGRGHFVEGTSLRVVAVIDVDTDETVFLRKHEADPSEAILLDCVNRCLVVRPCAGVIGLGALAGYGIDGHLLRLLSGLIRDQTIVDPTAHLL